MLPSFFAHLCAALSAHSHRCEQGPCRFFYDHIIQSNTAVGFHIHLLCQGQCRYSKILLQHCDHRVSLHTTRHRSHWRAELQSLSAQHSA